MTENALSILIIFSIQLQQTETSDINMFILYHGCGVCLHTSLVLVIYHDIIFIVHPLDGRNCLGLLILEGFIPVFQFQRKILVFAKILAENVCDCQLP